MSPKPGKKRYFLLIVVVLVLLLLSVLAARYFYGESGRSEKEIRNVVLISIDTCRADYLGCYGYPRPITPNIDAVAEEGILFENAITPVPITLPAHCSMLTGLNPLHHQIHDNLGYKLSSASTTLAEIMSRHGYKTAAVIGSFVLNSQFGLNQGFDYYNDKFEQTITTGNYAERRGGEVTEVAIKWITDNKDDKFFLFLHYYDPHFRYEPPQPYASRFSDNPYAGEIAYADHCVGQVIDKLKRLGIYDSALIVITGDHGEMLGEHGEAEHGFFIYQSALHVPLIIKPCSGIESKRIKNLVTIEDIVPTVCGQAGITPAANLQGEDLSDYFASDKVESNERFIYCESITPTKHNANALLGVVTAGWKYIETTRPELYDLINDPVEGNNLIAEEPKRAHLLREHLRMKLENKPEQTDPNSKSKLDDQTRKRLESLGYIAGKNIDDQLQIEPNKQDPKDVIKFHNIRACNDTAMTLAGQGKLREAAQLLTELTEHYEKARIQHAMGSIYYNLGVIYQRLGDDSEANTNLNRAVEEFKEELTVEPNSPEIWRRMGDALAAMGDYKLACEVFEKALSLKPDDPLIYMSLGAALRLQQQYERSVEVLQRGIELMSARGDEQAVKMLQQQLEQVRSDQKPVNQPN